MSELVELISYLEGQPEPHIVCDLDYRIVGANRAYRQRYGDGSSEVVGRTCHAMSHQSAVPCDQAGEACPLASARLSGHRERVLHVHHTPRGEEYVNIELTPIHDQQGMVVGFVESMDGLQVAQPTANSQGLVGRSASFREMMALVSRVAPAPAAVLLWGESGTGKELVAQALHAASPRAAAPFVPVDCSGLPETLFESELFGHEKGAFTGATTQKAGLAETANGGTLFIDEVGDIPLAVQVKLLRLLETGTYRRVGSTDQRRADLRIVSATHRDLHQRIADGLFRADLYYRISTFPIRLPPLRERREDIPVLIEALLSRLSPRRKLRVSGAAMLALSVLPYPGNVRELRNLLERAILLCDGRELTAGHVEQALALDAALTRLDDTKLESAPRRFSARAGDVDLPSMLKAFEGNREALAAELGISKRTLFRRLARARQKAAD
jgi:two-component system, NtrC family, response regulator HydG